MSFVSLYFLAFLAGVAAIAFLTPRKIRYIWLLVCSYSFYIVNVEAPEKSFENLPALGLLIGATLLSFFCAILIEKNDKQNMKRLFMAISLLACVGLLLAFKYYDFFILQIGELFSIKKKVLPLLNLIAPLGISYYILQTVGYTLDVYFGTIKADRNPLRYALFVSFFPSIVTGPINRAPHMLEQYKNPAKFDYNRIAGGLFRILWGNFKFMVLASNLGEYTNAVFSNLKKSTGPEVLFAALVYSYQLYINFSGSCDIAIGAAHLLGFDFTENFNRPFAAKTYSALWQRWHMSLTSFFRDYVFPPIVWSRWTEKLPFIGKYFEKPPAFSATIMIFVLSGLWHGPSGYYIIWGLLNGLIMAVAKKINKKREKLASSVPIYRNKHVRGGFQRIFVYLMFAGCIIFFAAAANDFSFFEWASRLFIGWNGLFSGKAFSVSLLKSGLSTISWVVLAASTFLVELVEKKAVDGVSNVSTWIRTKGWMIRWLLYALLLLSLLCFANLEPSAFIYADY